MRIEDENTKFEWTGKKMICIAYLLLRHIEYHIEESRLLLHISNNVVNDNWMNAFCDIYV
jgi:hypothetical protein